jgi:hypothetical protein
MRLAPALLPAVAMLCLTVSLAVAAETPGRPWTVVGAGRMDIAVLRGDAPLFVLHNNLTGPGWKGGRLEDLAEADGKTRLYTQKKIGFYSNWWANKPMPGLFDLRYELARTGPRNFRIRYVAVPDSDTTFGPPKALGDKSITIGPVLRPEPYFQGGSCTLTLAGGKTLDRPLPVPSSHYENVASVALKAASGEVTRLSFNPPLFIHCDHAELRCFSGGKTDVKAGETFTQEITLELPRPADFEPGNRYVDMTGWFPLDFDQAGDYAAPSALGMENWLHKPAGKHGWLRIKGKDFVFEDGTPVKFWGINICGPKAAPEKEDADRWADRCAKHGVNLVRFHKILNHIGNGWALDLKSDSTKLNEERARKFDYLSAALAERGVYYGWSQYYAYKLSPADKDRVLAYDELMAKGDRWFKGSTIMLVNFAPDLQDLHVKTLLNLLNRKNTVTGKTYAEDRALAYIEIQNEDDIFFYGLDRQVKACPTYYKLMKRQFSDWLEKKYGDRAAWEKAWNGKIGKDENWVDGTVDPFAEWIYDPKKMSRRVLDVYHYLYDAQTKYYKRVVKALRDAGYDGAVCGSCWQTATFLGHLYNVLSDREVGFIDRHNYGGGEMLSRPGRGLLSAGMQQVADRPYNFSEWAGGGIFGSMEMVPVIGFIGMGVQGWDASCHFASNSPGISRRLGGDVCDRFVSLAQYPAVARALYRGDFIETPPVAVRRVTIPMLWSGKLPFSENFSLLGGANIKEFSSVVRQEALGVGPVVLEFLPEGPVEKFVEDRSPEFINDETQTLRSASGQVRWDYSDRGFFTVNTPGTQALVGFGAGMRHELGDLSIETTNPVAFICVSARDPKETIANAGSLIVTALGRLYQRGSVVDEVTMDTIRRAPDGEKADQMLEPVTVTIDLKRKDPCRVFALDHGGRKPDDAPEIPVRRTAAGCTFALDANQTRAVYYLVEFDQN